PEQRISTGNAITSEQISLLATEMTNVDQLYIDVGDADAYARVRDLQSIIADTVREHGGTVIRTSGEATLSAFQCCDEAVKAAIKIDREVKTGQFATCRVGIGVHRGQVLIAAENDRNEFFGGAVRAAVAMPQKVKQGILLTESVFADPVVVRLIPDLTLDLSENCIDLPGLPGQRVLQLTS
ncbi:MAG: hypothetical protein KDB00_08610, partial [Planctomycetales bacterium]|nr:hypothetical protein [Planctomycetales bacterium]